MEMLQGRHGTPGGSGTKEATEQVGRRGRLDWDEWLLKHVSTS